MFSSHLSFKSPDAAYNAIRYGPQIIKTQSLFYKFNRWLKITVTNRNDTVHWHKTILRHKNINKMPSETRLSSAFS